MVFIFLLTLFVVFDGLAEYFHHQIDPINSLLDVIFLLIYVSLACKTHYIKLF